MATVAGQVRVLVSDGNGGHFESITDDTYFVVDTEYAHTLVSGFEKLAEKLRGYYPSNVMQVRAWGHNHEFVW